MKDDRKGMFITVKNGTQYKTNGTNEVLGMKVIRVSHKVYIADNYYIDINPIREIRYINIKDVVLINVY